MNNQPTNTKKPRKRSKQWKKRNHLRRKKHLNSTSLGSQQPRNSQSTGSDAVNRNSNNYWVSRPNSGCLNWQNSHQIAYWKSKAEALSYENKILHSVIRNLYLNQSFDPQTLPRYNVHTINNDEESEEESDSSCEEQEEENMAISEEFMSFLETSMKHKMKRNAEQREAASVSEQVRMPEKVLFSNKIQELKSLYGKSFSLIGGLETKAQLNFDRYKDLHKPLYWPCIPLNL